MENIMRLLNQKGAQSRLDALKNIVAQQKKIDELTYFNHSDANNHIHTIYSFSPYSPTLAAFMAYKAHLKTMGIMDHDTLSGAKEFLSACKILGTKGTVGIETRAHFDRGFGRINNPDQNDVVYVAAHGVPYQNIDAFNGYMEKFRKNRNIRNIKMTKHINDRFSPYGISLDFDKDVYGISQADGGGTVTERHLLFALAQKIFVKFKDGQSITHFLCNTLNIDVPQKIKDNIEDKNNPNIIYDILGVLKSDTSFFYIPATDECPRLEEFISFAKGLGAICAYAYLGDVGESVTGDKKAQKFEDAYLNELLAELKKCGIDAIAFMPTRNTEQQLIRLMDLCKKYQFFQISGEDINSPRQKFECPMLKNPLYSHLIQSTWALIGHEKLCQSGIENGMFSRTTVKKYPDLDQRIKYFAQKGRED